MYEQTRDFRNLPFKIASGAKSLSLAVSANGNVGLGTDSPTEKLHVVGNARIDGTLQVGQCSLDPGTCKFRKQGRGRRRNLTLGEEESSFLWEMDEDENDDGLEQYLESLERENERARETIQAMETRMKALEDWAAQHESLWMKRLLALEGKVAALNSE